MINQNDLIASESQLLQQDAKVTLFEFDLRDFEQGILRLTPGHIDGRPLSFDGYEYYPCPIIAEGFKWDDQGTAPQPTLTLSVMTPTIAAIIRDSNDLVGVQVKIIRTYRKMLDDGATPNPDAFFAPEIYDIEQKSGHNDVQVEFKLSSEVERDNLKIPGRQVIRDTCTHTYRRWDGQKFIYTNVTCPYAGESCYNRKRQGVQPSEDDCGKRLDDCKLRFGDSPLPFYGFPGVGRT